MSRRRPARNNRHLERHEAIAAQVTHHQAESGDPCPGPCNRAYRVRRDKHEDLRQTRLADLEQEALAWAQPPSEDALMELAREFADAKSPLLVPRVGRPIWCHRCTLNIASAVAALPRLIVWTLDMGAETAATRLEGGNQVPVTEPVQILSTEEPVDGLVVDHLACGHQHTRPEGPAPETRRCLTCLAGGIAPEPGRLAPPPKRAVGASRGGRAPVSPAGSPAWLEVDAALEWICGRTSQLRTLLNAEPHDYQGRSGSAAARLREAAAAVDWLEPRMDQALATPLAERFGREAIATESRLRAVSGMDRLTHRMPARCPNCGKKALTREDGARLVQCGYCRNTWDEQHYQHLVRVQAFEEQNPHLQDKPGEGK